MSIDFDALKFDYSMPDLVSASGVKLSRNGKEFLGLCPFHNEKTPSFTVYQKQAGWQYHCYGCGAHGDNIDYVCEAYGVAKVEAAEIITGQSQRAPVDRKQWIERADPYAGYTIKRNPPDDAPQIKAGQKTPPLLNPKRIDAATGKPKSVTYRPKMVFPYRWKDGSLIGYVLRVEFDDKKITPGIWWTENKEEGFEGWSHGALPEPRILYGLDRLYQYPTKQVLLVEGEKCADAGNRLLGDVVTCVTWPGGGKSISKVNWRYLEGRSVVIWPDNDVEGWRTVMGYATPDGRWHQGIAERLLDVGVKSLKIIHISKGSRPDGWDIADAEAEGLDGTAVSLIMRSQIQTWDRQRYNAWKKKEQEAIAAGAMPAQGVNDDGPTSDQRAGRGSRENVSKDESAPVDRGNRETVSEEKPVSTAVAVADRPRERSEEGERGIRGFGISDETWRQHLIMKADGDGLKTNSLQNFALLLQYEPRFTGIFAWNEFAKEVYLMRRPPWDIGGDMSRWTPRVITDTDVTSAACWLEYCGMAPKANDVGKVIVRVAQHNSFNPVVDVLKRLKWDGIPRVKGGDHHPCWLTYYLGAEPTEINRVFGMKWLIGGVARAFQPGCKMDTMLILEGPQGLKKSTALRILAEAIGPGLFTDEMSDPNSKDAGLQLQGAFIAEIAELDSFRKADVRQIKSWLARQTDRFRRPYGKIVETFPRSGIMAGTMNPSGTGYFQDASGARRFWPVRLEGIDLDLLRADALQLWAEAVQLYHAGETWWLDQDQEKLAAAVQADRYEEDPWANIIDEWARGKKVVTIPAIMSHLEIQKKDQNVIVNRRIAAHLHHRGWLRMIERERTVYKRGHEEEIQEDLYTH